MFTDTINSSKIDIGLYFCGCMSDIEEVQDMQQYASRIKNEFIAISLGYKY
jgi:hypothetical protein